MSYETSSFEFDERAAVDMKTFYQLYKDQFPMLAMIVDGCYGLTIYDTFSNFQAMRVHCATNQTRVVAVDSKAATAWRYYYYTIPLDYRIRFKVIKSHAEETPPQTLQQIVAENSFPIQVQFALDPKMKVKVGTDAIEVGTFGNLLLTKTYEHHYLLINCIEEPDQSMYSDQHATLALSEEITAVAIKGLKNKSKREYDALVKSLDDKIANSKDHFDTSWGHQEMDRIEVEDAQLRRGPCGIRDDDKPVIRPISEADPGPPPPIPKRGKSADDSEDEAEYERIDPNYFYELENPAVPPRVPIHQDAKAEPKKAPQKGKKGLFGWRDKKHDKKKHQQQDTDKEKDVQKEEMGGKKVPDYLNTKIGRAEVKPMQRIPSEPSKTPNQQPPPYRVVPKDTRGERSEMPLQASKAREEEEEEDGGEYYEVFAAPVSPFLKPNPTSDTQRIAVEELSIPELEPYFKRLRLEKYMPLFKDNMVDGLILSQLDKKDFQEQFGMSVIEAIRLNTFAKDGHIPK